jgi:apolipoprotein N-acyltransferase
VVLVLFVVVTGYGIFRMAEERSTGTIKVGAVQGNATLTESWVPSMKPVVVQRYLTLTRQVLADKPDLLVWPETAFPQFYWEYPELMEEVRALVRESKTPLLFGTVTREENEYFNSAILLTPPDGHESGRYSKQHLVVFGEYIPLRREMPFLADIVPIDDFTAGWDKTVFTLKGGARFGVLICFEDTVASLSREAVLGGSQFLVNITNDAWFKDSPGLRMQVYNALFRAVENRRSLLRVTNTGISCLIKPNGIVGTCIEDAQKKQVLIEGVMAPVVGLRTDISFYTKFSQAFTFLCFLIILGVSVPLLRRGCRLK